MKRWVLLAGVVGCGQPIAAPPEPLDRPVPIPHPIDAAGQGEPPAPIALGPAGAVTDVTLAYDYASLVDHRRDHFQLAPRPDGSYIASPGGRRVERALVDAVAAAARVDLEPGDGTAACIAHTDDYPVFAIELGGAQPVAIHARSNCDQWAPWNVAIEGAERVQYGGALARPVLALFAAVDPDHWRGRDVPIDLGESAQVFFQSYAAGETPSNATTLTAACARSFEAAPAIAAALGAGATVARLHLGCRADGPAPCRRPEGVATIAWGDDRLALRVACTAQGVDEAALAPSLEALRAFVGSRPVAAFRRAYPGGAKLEQVGAAWQLSREGAPLLAFDPAARTIEVRGGGDALWRELGIAPRPAGVIDLAGHLAKAAP